MNVKNVAPVHIDLDKLLLAEPLCGLFFRELFVFEIRSLQKSQ